MSLRRLPEAKAPARPAGLDVTPPSPVALDRWDSGLRAAGETAGDNVISILDVIGDDPWSSTGGITARRVAAALRAIGQRDVVVDINSPGGDYFEGLAIYNLLRQHPHRVTVRVIGLAASAASVVAMAGDTVQVPRAGFLMLHNCWVVALGDRNDLGEAIALLEPFDGAMADIYSARSGLARDAVAEMMDRETWIAGAEAVDRGLADELLPSDQVAEDASARAATEGVRAVRRMDALLARSGLTRSERRSLIADVKGGTRDAAPTAMQDAGLVEVAASLRRLATIIET